MRSYSRLATLLLTSFLVLAVSAFYTAPALADDSTPPPTDTPLDTGTTETTPVVEQGTPTPEPVLETTPTEITTQPEEVPVVDDTVSSETLPITDETSTAAEILAQVPQGTDLVVVNSDGETLPLASEETAQVIADGDPMWCPVGVTPGGAGCSISYTNLKALVDDVGTGLFPAANGIIWITGYATNGFAADSSAANIIFNGTLNPTWDTWNDFTLTLKGGWTGGGTTINTADASVFNKTIGISNWNANVTLSDITISSASGDGLTVTTTKDISLTRVTSNGNLAGGMGAYLNNTSGTGKITVNSSQFNSNAGSYGLYAESNGTITLSNITASQNTVSGGGAYLDNHNSPSKSGVTLSGLNTFNGNKWDGLLVYTQGAVLANDLTVSDNGNSGITGGGATFSNGYLGATAGVTLTGLNIFNDNYGVGLYVSTNGAIKLNNVIANSNNNRGVQLDNSMGPAAQPITLTGSNQFKYNTYDDLYIVSKGLISLNNVVANGSTNGNGFSLDQCVWNGSACDGSSSGGLKLTGTNAFNDNLNYGIYALSVGALTLNNVTANGNGLPGFGYGVYLDNCNWTGSACANTSPKSVTLTGTSSFNNNKNGGLYVNSLGAIKLNNLTANGTVSGYGADVNNDNPGAVGGVTVSGMNFFNDNYSNGLGVSSYGAISLSNAKAVGNGLGGSGDGAYLDNSAGSAKPVTVSGVNEFSDNKSSGLAVSSAGAIKLNSIIANGSTSGYGVQLYTSYNSATIYSVMLTGTNVFNNNYQNGLSVEAHGMISLTNVTANENNNLGMYALNTGSGSLTPRNVVMTGTNLFNDNGYSGLDIESYGSISVANVTASGNGLVGLNGFGAYLYNSTGTIPKGITLSGSNVFNGNYNAGLFVSSLGAIGASNLTADDNGVVNSNGAYLSNGISGAVGGMTLSGTNTFNGNYEEGLIVSSYGAITINNLRANDNGTNSTHEGAQLSNSGADPLFPKAVTLTGINQFNGNFGYGLTVYSLGLITASNLTANENQNHSGVGLYNDIGSSTAGVTLKGINVFTDNWNSGLEVGSFGTINLLTTSVTANGNGLSLSTGFGVGLVNSSASTPQVVKLLGTNIFNDNYDGGLQITSLGAITVNNVTANSNTNGLGANLNNSGGGAAGSVILTGTNSFNANYSGGLLINSRGAITASKLTASDNTNGGGTILTNDLGTGNVTLSGTNTFSGNYDTGLEITTNGAITLNNVTANQNGLISGFGYGGWLVNSSSSTHQAVKMTGTNIFNGNKSGGLTVYSVGAITINNLSASYNLSGGGASFSNNGGGVGNVILTGLNTFSENNGNGLQIGSNGNVSLTKIIADGNNGDGLYTNPGGTISLTCGSFTNNTAYGWHLSSLAGITLTGVISAGNGSGDSWFGSFPVIVRNCPLP